MPTYEYECQKCQYRFELSQSMKEAPKKTCPKCKGRVKRLFGTGAGIIFKGSGFYSTDYRKPGYTDAAKKDTTPAPAAPATDSKSTTTKKPPASKTPADKD